MVPNKFKVKAKCISQNHKAQKRKIQKDICGNMSKGRCEINTRSIKGTTLNYYLEFMNLLQMLQDHSILKQKKGHKANQKGAEAPITSKGTQLHRKGGHESSTGIFYDFLAARQTFEGAIHGFKL